MYVPFSSNFNTTDQTVVTSTPILVCRDNLLNQNWSGTTNQQLRTNIQTKINGLTGIDSVEETYLSSTRFITKLNSLTLFNYKHVSGETLVREKILYYFADSILGRDITSGIWSHVD